MPTIARTRIATVTSGQTSAEKDTLAYAGAIIRRGGLVVFPTETVYGLGADGTKAESVKAIYEAKGRPADNPLILHVADPEQVSQYAYTNELFDRLAERFMPGPLTVVLPARDVVPREVTAGLDTVAVRCPSHPVAQMFLEACETAVALAKAYRVEMPITVQSRRILAGEIAPAAALRELMVRPQKRERESSWL